MLTLFDVNGVQSVTNLKRLFTDTWAETSIILENNRYIGYSGKKCCNVCQISTIVNLTFYQ